MPIKVLFVCHGTMWRTPMHSGANLGIMRHILPDRHFLTTKKLRPTKDKILKCKGTEVDK